MAGLMASPMLIIELLLMAKMYPNKKLSKVLMGVGVLAMVLFWSGFGSMVTTPTMHGFI